MIVAVQQAFPQLSLRQICRWLGVSRSWYYACPSVEARAARGVALRDAIEHIILAFPGYGYRRVTYALQREGWDVNHTRVLRVMRQESLLCQLKRRFVLTTDATHGYATYPNLLATTAVTTLDQVWVAEIVCTQMTKTDVFTARLRRKGIANLDVIVRHYDAVDKQLDQLSPLLEGHSGEPRLHTLAEVLQVLRDTRYLLTPLGLLRHLLLLFGERLVLLGPSGPVPADAVHIRPRG